MTELCEAPKPGADHGGNVMNLTENCMGTDRAGKIQDPIPNRTSFDGKFEGRLANFDGKFESQGFETK